MTAFAYELAAVLSAQQQARPGDREGPYALPWYLVIGEPGTGRTTAIKALNRKWPRGDAPIATRAPTPLCTYWLPETAVFIEPEGQVLGPQRNKSYLMELCEELRDKRPREPIDGVVVVVNISRLADSDEDGVEKYAKELRSYLIEIGRHLERDVPVYVAATAYDDLWGFGDAFQWSAERADEEPWGFSLPVHLEATEVPARVPDLLEGLGARIESYCFAKLSTEDPWDARMRAFQHLYEARAVLDKLIEVMKALTMSSAYERAPWVRAMIIGSGMPGTGHKRRHNHVAHVQMGLQPPAQSGTPTPGGLPIHAMLDNVLIPERDIVPTVVRWRDDKLTLIPMILGILGLLAYAALFVVRTLAS